MPVLAQDDARDTARDRESDDTGFRFSLLPTAFQKDPLLRFNVITEMTEAGRELPLPSPERPAYYVLRPRGYFGLGQGVTREYSPPTEVLLDAARRSLASSGYVAASDPSDPISLVLVLDWGSFSWGTLPPIGGEGIAEVTMERVLEDPILWQEMLERASLVGGVDWAERLHEAMHRDAQGSIISQISKLQRNSRDSYRLVQTFQDFYFVVASALDPAAALEGEPVLLWRTKMTVSSSGVAMSETLRPLIASAAPYFGVEMTDLARIRVRIDREGKVEMAPIEVIEYIEPVDTSDSPTEESEAPSPTEDE